MKSENDSELDLGKQQSNMKITTDGIIINKY